MIGSSRLSFYEGLVEAEAVLTPAKSQRGYRHVGTSLDTGCHFSGLRGLTRTDEKAGLRGIMPT